MLGGSGFDQLYGGGGDDEIWGGPNSDILVGQQGLDHLRGGTGIDIIQLDTDPAYGQGDDVDGHGGNGPTQPAPDDNATDILQIEGTSQPDVIRIRQSQTRDLVVDYNGRIITLTWRDGEGEPLIEQFQIDGLLGEDTIEFVQGSDSVDSSALVGRSNDFIAVLQGGTG